MTTKYKRLWVGPQDDPDERIQIVISEADNALPRDEGATVTDLLTGNRITIRSADCGLPCKCALEISALAKVEGWKVPRGVRQT